MIRVDTKRSPFYLELDSSQCKEFFDLKGKAYLHNIDTFYYSISLKDDSNDNTKLDELFMEIDDIKKLMRETNGKEESTFYGLNVKLGAYGMVYLYRLQEPDLYDIYISHYLPNKTTPRIVVQLRSYGLWLHGVDTMILMSYEKVKNILKNYECDICLTKENRIDYAFHTNIIQNPYKFFSDRNLDKYLYTTLTKYYKIGDIRRKKKSPELEKDSRFTLDYFALGQLKSNNLFNRNYNKVKEVIELNYKAFFFDMWYDKGLINFYDLYCFRWAYTKKNYNAIDEGRLRFYLEYGKNEVNKQRIRALLKKDYRYAELKELADELTPFTTLIMNVEFQTKRKFYYYADEQIELLPIKNSSIEYPLKRLFKILDNRKLFLDYITSESISFIRKIEEGEEGKIIYYQDFWNRLRSLKIDCITKDKEYIRKRNNELDIEKKTKDTVNSIAMCSLYKGKKDSDFIEDVSDLIGHLNDNDMKNYELVMVNKETGEIEDLVNGKYGKYLKDYHAYKDKKNKAIKNRICDSRPKDSK